MHPLDNVIWNALTTRDAQFAEGNGISRRFIRDVGPLGAFVEHGDAGYESLAELVKPGGTVGLFLDEPYAARPGWNFVVGAPLLQMIWASAPTPAPGNGRGPEVLLLGAKDSDEMIELTALTKPGPFTTRTHELGTYLGIRDGGKLVAMAGERLKVPGHTEVSAVCTHPDHVGKGYGRTLMTAVMRGIQERGETPFLHVRQDNERAIALYEKLGFIKRHWGHFAVIRASEE
ncbi:MAG TPA: GNAT family N-acetyltransferase [Candidatus Sulfotelmatobacter sp.]|jgi:ribosomal protein S18 acetylase RimI-like enzyme